MILVDTNIWSELMRAEPNPCVKAWELAHADHLYLATIVMAELLSGAHLLPEGKRKQALLAGYDELVDLYAEKIVAFDLAAAREYGFLLAKLEKSGRNPTTADVQIAAIAASRKMTLATRNVRDFEGLDLTLLNPWEVQ
jgi:toxin FitB